MPTSSASRAATFDETGPTETSPAQAVSRLPVSGWGIAASASWLGVTAVSLARDDVGDWSRTATFAYGAAVVALAAFVVSLAGARLGQAGTWFAHRTPWLIVLGLGLALWELVTAKLGWLPLPFFPPPQALLEVYLDDFGKLGASVLASVKLQISGYAIGAVIGFLTGVSIGWSRSAGYWVHPVLRFIGPLPATAWLPVAFFLFPSSWSASIFLIALATAFPVTVLTWSGVASVPSSYYDVARTLGATPWFLIRKVAVPAAMPHMFVGLFMGLGASFAVLVVAEMMGVKAGLGWYLQWAQGWAAYANMYAALIVMSLLCSGAITLLFKVRDRLLSWQKGVVKW
ncbi:ABC transporter permease subunit [Bradyrhizobium sp. LHD-71]|uniref:ABC transporter permease n=1 Tax=Bradyrhizobium sp. LHD-71 TaxID=3072141 RepID=UPI00280DF57A|nr:ABC transporter permease subunit [Bradyrhizobium sp. LHD-71]MDQ8730870.1 ABC transporter permease subunit [Bradyrhizobium sp. LHD-71]